MRDCVKRIIERSGGKISKAEAKQLVHEVDREAKRRVNEGFDYDEAVKDVLRERLDNATHNLAKEKANAARNMVLIKRGSDKISQFIEGGLSVKKAFIAELEGISSDIKGTRASLDTQKQAVEHAYFSSFLGELNREGLLPLLNSKTLDDEIGKELWALSNKKKGATESKEAAKIAEIIFKTREQQRLRLNKAGADIGEAGGYIMPQRHDTYDMFKAGEDKWTADMLPLVDEARSFGGDYDDLESALRQAYRAMVSGVRLNDPTVKNEKLFQFTGPANLGKKLSQARQIHFKDFDSWKAWNQAYGMKDLNEGVIDAIRFDSDNIALMERYGTNPEAMLKEIANDIKARYRDKIAKEGEQGIDNKINDIINAATGKNNIPASPRLASIGANIRAYNNVTSLGGAVLSQLGDIPMKSLEYNFQGKNWLSATAQPLLDFANGFQNKQDKTEFLSLLGVYSEGMVGNIGARITSQDTLTGKAAKVQRLFFKLNGMSWWTDTAQNSFKRTMSHHLGLKKDTSFDKLDADTQRLFGNYNISKDDWDIIRSNAVKLEDGRHYIVADGIEDSKVKEKLIGYFVDRSNFAVTKPTTREQRMLSFGTQKGTPVGEFVRLIGQFKSFPVSVITKIWGRALYGKGKADVPAMAYLFLSTMMFGYLSGAAKDLVKGRAPKDPQKLETIYASIAQGGGLGILADVLLQDGSSFGRSASSALAGPTFGKIDDLLKIYSAGVRGGGSAGQAFRTGVGLVPFNNLFYTRAAFDQILLLEIQESLNPGYLKRMESNMKKTYGQELLFK